MKNKEPGLVADIGATNARFAVVRPDGTITLPRTFALNDYATISEVIEAYLRAENLADRPVLAAIGIASPVTGDEIAMTNHPWRFSIENLRREFGFRQLHVINDFAASALAVPQLEADDRIQVGRGLPVAQAPIGVIGPGTGLGISALVPWRGGFAPIQSEGGHATMPPADERESSVLDLLRRRYDHVSAERLLSGPGLVNLYNALCELSRAPAAQLAPAQITDARVGKQDERAAEATAMFFAMLGTVAGNLALTLGARGGIYIAGGIVPKLGGALMQSRFRDRFEAKGRLRDYVVAIPTYVIIRPLPALLGLTQLLDAD